MKPSIARGLAWVAVVAVAVVVARAALVASSDRSGDPAVVCHVPVEMVTDRGGRLACATDAALRACPGLRPGDRVSGACQIESGAMVAVMRLLSGVPIDINRASATDLELLKGIGPKLADAIVSERERQPFDRIDDLVRVRGIGPAKLEAMRPYVAVVGAR